MGKRVYKSKFDPYKDWIMDHYLDYSNLIELADAIRGRFDLDVRVPTLRDWMRKQLNSGTVYNDTILWSEDQVIFLKTHYESKGAKYVADHVGKSEQAVNGKAFRLGIQTIGKHHMDRSPIGSERIDKSHTNGYRVKIKVAKGHEGWVDKGRYIFENQNGKIPEGYVLVYLDGNPMNCEIDNLATVDPVTFYQVVHNKAYKSNNPTITKTLIRYYELRNSLGLTCDDVKRLERKLNRLYSKEVFNERIL